MAPPHSAEAWQRVGRMLKQRRVQLNQRYRIRRIFAQERGISDKTAQEIENAPNYRTSFSAELVAAIETAYGIAAGSVDKALADPEMTKFADRDIPALAVAPNVQLGREGDPDPRDVIPGDPISAEKGEVTIWAMTALPWEWRRDLILHLRDLDEGYRAGRQGPAARRQNGTEG